MEKLATISWFPMQDTLYNTSLGKSLIGNQRAQKKWCNILKEKQGGCKGMAPINFSHFIFLSPQAYISLAPGSLGMM